MAVRATSGLDMKSIGEMVGETVAHDFLEGRVRGQSGPLLPSGTAERTLHTFAELARAFNPGSSSPWTLEELEVNPMAVDARGRLLALDGLGRFSRTKDRVRPRPEKGIRSLLEPASVLVTGASGKFRCMIGRPADSIGSFIPQMISAGTSSPWT